MCVLEADTAAGAGLDLHLMAPSYELLDPRRHEADTIFVDLDLFGDADFHGWSSDVKEQE